MNNAIPETHTVCDLPAFEKILFDRAGGGPSTAQYDPELLAAGSDLLDEVRRLRHALTRYASPGEWSAGDYGTCYAGRLVAAKALGRRV